MAGTASSTLGRSAEHYTVDGIPARYWEAGLEDHQNGGRENEGILFFERDGQRRVLKILLKEHEEFEAEILQAAIRGAKMAEALGGPKLYRHGTIRMPSGEERYYLEMEELMPGSGAVPLKSLLESKSPGPALIAPRGSRPPPIEEVTDQILHALESGVIPSDMDFLIAADGRVRWVDAQKWWGPFSPADRQGPFFCEGVARVIDGFATTLNTFAPEAVAPFLLRILRGIKHSRSFTDAQRTQFIEQMFPDHGSSVVDRVRIEMLIRIGVPPTDIDLDPRAAIRRYFRDLR